jgi:hypothetical protein
VRAVKLYVFDVGGTNAVPLLVRQIKETRSFLNSETGRRVTTVSDVEPYWLEATLDGKPRIRWLKSSAITVLDVKK